MHRRRGQATGTGVMLALGLAVGSVGQCAQAASAAQRVPVLSVAQVVQTPIQVEKQCWQVLISDREQARRAYASQPWLLKHWKPIVGGVLGAAVAHRFTGNYGESSRKWVWPTVAAGAGVGALVGPGFVLGAYGLGALAYARVPGKLPLVAVAALLGGVVGSGLVELLFPDDPPADLMATPQPGHYLPDQQFYVETVCALRHRARAQESHYRVSYRIGDDVQHALVRHYPRDTIALDAQGRPLDRVSD